VFGIWDTYNMQNTCQHQIKLAIAMAEEEQPYTVEFAQIDGNNIWGKERKKDRQFAGLT
jgi:hypothetical protein